MRMCVLGFVGRAVAQVDVVVQVAVAARASEIKPGFGPAGRPGRPAEAPQWLSLRGFRAF